MPLCNNIQLNGTPCTRQGNAYPALPNHLHFCWSHLSLYVRRRTVVGADHEEGKCLYYNNRRWCTHDHLNDSTLCATHTRVLMVALERRQRLDEIDERIRILRERLLDENRPWREMVRVFATQIDDDQVIYRAVMEIYIIRNEGPRHFFQAYWNWAAGGEQGAEPQDDDIVVILAHPPRRDLQALARDPQNVHTQAVSTQTNAATEKLLAALVPTEQQTEKSIVRAWMSAVPTGWNRMLTTLTDVNKWFTTKTCRVPDDMLYRQMLRGLVATINRTDEEQRAELYKRLWEECNESVGMCCEGHISRLCNVMVGFDDAFQPQVSLGELIQQKMAAIAGLDVAEDEKRRQATQWFDEHAVQADQRVAWLDAF